MSTQSPPNTKSLNIDFMECAVMCAAVNFISGLRRKLSRLVSVFGEPKKDWSRTDPKSEMTQFSLAAIGFD